MTRSQLEPSEACAWLDRQMDGLRLTRQREDSRCLTETKSAAMAAAADKMGSAVGSGGEVQELCSNLESCDEIETECSHRISS